MRLKSNKHQHHGTHRQIKIIKAGLRLLPPQSTTWFMIGFFLLGLVLTAFATGVAPVYAQSCTTLVSANSFDNDGVWQTQSDKGYSLLSNFAVYSGNRAAYLGGVDNANDLIHTTVSLPAEQTSKLRFRWLVDSEESSDGWDGLNVIVADAAGNQLKTLHTLSSADSGDTWQSTELDLSEFAGQTAQIQFAAQTDGSLVTDFFIDEPEVTSCAAGNAETFKIYLPFTTR